MAEPPEFWMFIASNALIFGLGGVLSALSYAAYRRNGQGAMRRAAAGFALITAGGLIEAVYELGIRGSYHLSGRELLALHSVEGVVIAVGLGMLFLSIRAY